MSGSYSRKRAALIFVGAILTPLVASNVWAQFCDDNACSVNCGTSLSVSNPSCVENEIGRKSVKVHGNNFIGSYLVNSPDGGCSCQNDCTAIPGTGLPACIDLTKKKTAQSYRFQLTTCMEDEAGSGSGVGDNCNASSSSVEPVVPTTPVSSSRKVPDPSMI
ncbi:hypothetical protein F5B19DRAFT_174520 [Rostrohypoxylon terebratum]|nr:hypothetical protein F5B19DRAFT_174520 [Rostrohypoxylon terebratum]